MLPFVVGNLTAPKLLQLGVGDVLALLCAQFTGQEITHLRVVDRAVIGLLRIDLAVAFAEFFDDGIRHADDLEALAAGSNFITEFTQSRGQLVPKNLGKQAGAPDDLRRIECLPALLYRIKRKIKKESVKVELRIEGAAAVMLENARHHVVGVSRLVLAVFAHSRAGQGLNLPQRDTVCSAALSRIRSA